MAGDLMKELHGNLWRLSPESYAKLKSLYEGNTLTLEEQNSLQNEIIAHRDIRRVHPLLD